MKVKPVAGRLNYSCYGEHELSSWSYQLRRVGQSGSYTEESDVETRGKKRGSEWDKLPEKTETEGIAQGKIMENFIIFYFII